MKNGVKMVLLILAIVILATSCSSNKSATPNTGKRMTLHADTEFGMSKTEIIDHENAVGNELREKHPDGTGSTMLYCEEINIEGALVSRAKIADHYGAVNYLFDNDGGMNCCLYGFQEYGYDGKQVDCLYYEKFYDNMVSKYGKPTYSGDTYIEIGQSFDSYKQFKRIRLDDSKYDVGLSKEIKSFSQWIIPLDKGYMEIQYAQFNVAYKTTNFNDLLGAKIRRDDYYLLISYSYITSDEYNSLVEKGESFQESMDRDL